MSEERDKRYDDDGDGMSVLTDDEATRRQREHLKQLTNRLRRDNLLGKRKKVRTDDDDDPTHRH